jgi:capsular polysaccharide transport system ATP-binding protein
VTIILDSVSKIYETRKGERVILDNASLTINRGESLGILGRNGAGKTTLLRMIGGVEAPTGGQIRREMSVSWPLGFAGGFQGSLTGAENTRFIARIYGVPLESALKSVNEFAELGDYFYVPVKNYSSGMMARLSFGLSLAIEFDCYLIDEIIAVGDPSFRRKCDAALAARRANSSTIMVSHEMATLKRFCSSAAVLNNAKLTYYPDIEEAARVYSAL